MLSLNMHEAKSQLSKMVDQALAGEEVIIAKAGVPAVRLVPVVQAARAPRVPGALRGQIWMADDFDAPLPEDVQKYFEGRGDD
ncbi:type II toxin-antitoxin system prevent-host-death family antitoxin [Uliginosibacterium sediminicola]|uniref:Antitoxin n=1 Tax=Uliginosibacterium sediminicola TaxID=2024550 RepID=A0ABU9Z013_9RHOO